MKIQHTITQQYKTFTFYEVSGQIIAASIDYLLDKVTLAFVRCENDFCSGNDMDSMYAEHMCKVDIVGNDRIGEKVQFVLHDITGLSITIAMHCIFESHTQASQIPTRTQVNLL